MSLTILYLFHPICIKTAENLFQYKFFAIPPSFFCLIETSAKIEVNQLRRLKVIAIHQNKVARVRKPRIGLKAKTELLLLLHIIVNAYYLKTSSIAGNLESNSKSCLSLEQHINMHIRTGDSSIYIPSTWE